MDRMNKKEPNLYIIAGPNGAGKTTFARKFLPDYVKCLEFINADLIAGGLSPFVPERAAIQAGRIMIEKFDLSALIAETSVLKQPCRVRHMLDSFLI